MLEMELKKYLKEHVNIREWNLSSIFALYCIIVVSFLVVLSIVIEQTVVHLVNFWGYFIGMLFMAWMIYLDYKDWICKKRKVI